MSFLDPMTKKKFARFRSIRRGWWSFVFFFVFGLVSLITNFATSKDYNIRIKNFEDSLSWVQSISL